MEGDPSRVAAERYTCPTCGAPQGSQGGYQIHVLTAHADPAQAPQGVRADQADHRQEPASAPGTPRASAAPPAPAAPPDQVSRRVAVLAVGMAVLMGAGALAAVAVVNRPADGVRVASGTPASAAPADPGAAPASPPPPAPTAAPFDPTGPTRRVTSPGISLAVPRGWLDFRIINGELDAAGRQLAARHPDAAELVKGLTSTAGGGLQLAAVDPERGTAVMVMAAPGAQGSLDKLSPSQFETILRQQGASDVVARRVRFPAGAALEATMKLPQAEGLPMRMFVFVHAGRTHMLAYLDASNGPPTQAEAIAASISFTA